MLKPKPICIFCGKNRDNGPEHVLTKEDVWPIWLTKYIPRDLRNYGAETIIVHRNRIEKSQKKVDGDPRSRRVKLVCKKCNTGWMSQLQERAKNILLPLMTGGTTILGDEAQKLVAAWCAMSTMTADFIFPDKQAIPQTDRDLLLAIRLPPSDTWKIWIGRFQRKEWVPHFVKQSIPIKSVENAETLPPSGIPRPNTQTTTLIFGELYVHVFSSIFPHIIASAGVGNEGVEKIAQLWPVREHFIAWPINIMSDRNADAIVDEIFKRLTRERNRSGG
jgi:hypothetical protein